MAGGRPTKYLPEYCQMLIEHMKSGRSFDSFAAVIKVNVDTLYEWVKVHEEFSEAKKEAFVENLLFWEDMGIMGAVGKLPGFNPTTWIFNMKNRHRWRDRIETTNDTKITGTIDLHGQVVRLIEALENEDDKQNS